MSKTAIPQKVRAKLWLRAGGRCQYDGCNDPLWRDELTLAEMNKSYIAHIVADSPDGPRGDPVLSPLLAKEFSNLMLMCDAHHRLIDHEQLAEHPVERLQRMKENHERRIERLTNIAPEKSTHVVLYGANVGSHSSPVRYARAVEAIVPSRYPASEDAIELGMINSAGRDSDADFWAIEEGNLRKLVGSRIKDRLSVRELHHISIFALAPQPLLVLLGSLISDIPSVDVYQLHREPPTWRWLDDDEQNGELSWSVERPDVPSGRPILVLAVSATVTNERVHAVLGEDVSIWRLKANAPHNDVIQTAAQLSSFRSAVRPLLDEIKAAHGETASLAVFPAAPVSVAVELGRIHQPKADLEMELFDQNARLGGFVPTVRVGNARPQMGGTSEI